MLDGVKKEDLEGLEKKALDQLLSGESLFGKDGAFAPLLKSFLEKALEAEMDAHLNENERSQGNKRNGKGRKTVKSSVGEFCLEVPQDRRSKFNPEIIPKRQRILAESLEGKILGLYGLGMSYRDISKHIKEMYDSAISISVLNQITDKILPEIKEWQSRPLDKVYPIVWLDAMHFKLKEEGSVVSKALYNILGINQEGKKEILGMYISQSEGANFWLSVLTDLNNRGLEDILIGCTDNLSGFSEAILSVFPKTEVQLCIVHQIRNSLKYVASIDQKEFLGELKTVYRASTKDLAEENLLKLDEKWRKKYPIVMDSWQRNWEKLSTYFQYTESIRRLIYTTNPVEGFHRQIRKVTKTKGAFTHENALLKLVYLATKRIQEKWNSPMANWSLTIQQLAIKFQGRINLKI